MEQSADGEVVVHSLSARSGDWRVGADIDAVAPVAREQLTAISAAAAGDLRERLPVRATEDDPVARALGAIALLVKEAVVVSTEQDEV